jgi:hypothetical protein
MAGFIGGRLFQVDTSLPPTVERLKLGDPTAAGTDASGLSAADYVEQFANAVLASAIPDASGNMRLVSRSSGAQRLRQTGPTTGVGVQAAERSARKTLQTYRGYVSEVRVNYTDALTGDSRQAVVVPDHAGGKPLSLDLSALVGGVGQATAIGQAVAFWFGSPAPVLTETWVDRTGGVAQDLDPPFWATWQIGDLITFATFTTPTSTSVDFYKIHLLKPGPEARSVDVELLKLPTQLVPLPGWI